MSKKLAILGIFVVIGLTAGGIAFATIPDSDGVIHACSQKFTGLLRVVDDPSACRRFEQPLDWNAQGQPGEKGETGERGTAGIGTPYERFVPQPVTVNPLQVSVGSVACDDGDVPMGPVFEQNNFGSTDIVVTDSFPDLPSGWVTFAKNTNPTAARTWLPGVWCADVNP